MGRSGKPSAIAAIPETTGMVSARTVQSSHTQRVDLDSTKTDGRALSAAAEAPLDYKKMYERISSMARIGVWEYDLRKHELKWTDAVYDLFELPRGTSIDRAGTVECYSAASRAEMEQLRAQAIDSGGSFSIDIEIRTFRGTPRWVHLTADVEQEDGVSVRIFGTKQDITDRKKAQEQVRLLQAELVHTSGRNAMSSMAATLAHELNQPLAAIANYATGVERLLRPVDVPDLAIYGLEEIEANAIRAGEIIRRMRSMVERGRGRTEAFDLGKVLREAVSSACIATAETSYKLQFTHSGDVAGDPVQVLQVAVNIIRNACEAMAGGLNQEVTVGTRDDDAFVVVTISDTGPGLPQGLTLFEPTESTKQDGMGIGLSICRTIVEANGGKIWSEDSDAGATICFSIPREEAR